MEEVRPTFETLLKEAIKVARGQPGISHSGRIPFYDMQYDSRFRTLPEFASASTRLETLPAIEKLYGKAESARLVLYFIYGYMSAAGPQFDRKIFEANWRAFWDELHEPNWRFLAVCNLSNFTRSITGVSGVEPVTLCDGVAVRGRDREWIDAIDSNLWILLADDWLAGSYGEYVLTSEASVLKTADNLVLTNDVKTMENLSRAMLALRLAGHGDVRHGKIFYVRPTKFPMGPRAGSYSGWSQWYPGDSYALEDHTLVESRRLIAQLGTLEPALAKGWTNLATALRSFSSLYERTFGQREDRILDAITAIEAMLGDKLETTFKLAYRVATVLESADDLRAQLYRSMKLWYGVRSALVHGEDLTDQHRAVIQDPRKLFEVTRRLLVGFLNLAESGTVPKARTLKQEIDEILLHSKRRDDLRSNMGF